MWRTNTHYFAHFDDNALDDMLGGVVFPTTVMIVVVVYGDVGGGSIQVFSRPYLALCVVCVLHLCVVCRSSFSVFFLSFLATVQVAFCHVSTNFVRVSVVVVDSDEC